MLVGHRGDNDKMEKVKCDKMFFARLRFGNGHDLNFECIY